MCRHLKSSSSNCREHARRRAAPGVDSELDKGPTELFNAEVLAAHACNGIHEDGPKVAVMKFSRFPAEFKQVVETCPQIELYGQALKAHKFKTVLDNGAKVFVRPEHYIATMNAITTMEAGKLFSSHMVVEPELVVHLTSLAKNVPGGKVRRRDEHCKVVSLGYPYRFNVKWTFLDIPNIKNAGPKTASTTDVDPRRGANPRP